MPELLIRYGGFLKTGIRGKPGIAGILGNRGIWGNRGNRGISEISENRANPLIRRMWVFAGILVFELISVVSTYLHFVEKGRHCNTRSKQIDTNVLQFRQLL
jgi:hypothetical protein